MGTYYMLANHTKKEFVSFVSAKNCGIKYNATVFGIPARVLTWLMADRWRRDHVEIVADSGENYYEMQERYRDASGVTFDGWNEFVGHGPDVSDLLIERERG